MTTVENDPSTDADVEAATKGRWRSARGKFRIFRAPKVEAPAPLGDVSNETLAERFDYTPLLDAHDETDVQNALGEMVRVLHPGITSMLLFGQRGPDGMSLYHVSFGPNLPLFRHSHPVGGDCLYYVLSGEIRLGSQVLGRGDGFFVPNEMPYKYTAGPDGAEVLEFRAGKGIPGAPVMVMNEPDLASIKRLTDQAREHTELWESLEFDRVGDGSLIED